MAKPDNPRRRRETDARRQQAREDAQRRAYRKAVRKRQMIGVGVLIAVLVAVVATIGLAGSDNATKATTTTTPLATTTTTGLGNTKPPVSLPPPTPGATLTGDTPCPKEDGSSPRTTHFDKAPVGCIDPTLDYKATIHTTKGNIVVELLPGASPLSVNNFVALARYHYYDGLPITRIVPHGWAEIADPVGPDGKPGPGYSVPNETQKQGSIATPLIVAMIPDKSGGSGGGFLIGLADQAPSMPKTATQIGNILDSRVDQSPNAPKDSIDHTVQQEIDKTANKSGQPTEIITITGIDIEVLPATTGTTLNPTVKP